jgi:outer membrane scaffolding protein for murein synthesis (MipA/OmpV family)
MRTSLSLFSSGLLMVACLLTWTVRVTGQTKNIAIGAGVGYNQTPYYSYEESVVPAEFNLSIQGVIGCGGYIPIKEKNLINVEISIRIGLNKVFVNVDDYEEARMVAILFILGYLRRL